MRALADELPLPAGAKVTAARESSGLAGAGRIEVQQIAGRSEVCRAISRSPLKLLNPRRRDSNSAWIFLSTYGGGLVGGDSIRFDLVAGEDTSTFIGTQSLTKIYRTSGPACRQDVQVTARDGAVVVWTPDPLVCFKDSIYQQRQRFDLESGASLVMLDWITSGRRACGERWAFSRYSSDTEITLTGGVIFRDALLLDPADGPLDAASRMGRFDCFATLVVLGPRVQQRSAALLDWVGRQPISRDLSLVFAASPIDHGVVIRVAGSSTEDVGRWIHQRLGFITEFLGADPWVRKW